MLTLTILSRSIELPRLSYLLLCIIPIHGCNPPKNEIVETRNYIYTDCKEIIETFEYPIDINRLGSLSFICDSSKIVNAARKKNLDIALVFSDYNYELLTYDFRTKFLHDKRNGLILCFKRNVDDNSFNRRSIEKIYLLADDLMPIYCITFNPVVHSQTFAEKFIYGSSPQSVEIIIDNESNLNLRKLKYSDIIRICKKMRKGSYKETEIHGSCCPDSVFRHYPLWAEN